MYCTIDDIKKKRIPEGTLIQLTDDEEIGAVDQTKVDAAIADASALIDGFLRKRYALPLSVVPAMLAPLAASIAAWNLYGLRAEFETPERVKADHDNAVATLKLIQKGEVLLGVGEPETAEAPDSPLSVSAPGTMFGRDTLDRY